MRQIGVPDLFTPSLIEVQRVGIDLRLLQKAVQHQPSGASAKRDSSGKSHHE